MTARAFEETMIEEGQASLDAYELSTGLAAETDFAPETVADAQIDAAQAGIVLLGCLILELASGTKPTVTIQEIGQALVGKQSALLQIIFERDAEIRKLKEGIAVLEGVAERYSKVQPNWFEKVCLAKHQDRLLRDTARLLAHAINTAENEIFATRWSNVMAYVEDAYEELKDDYAPEGDEPSGDPCRDYQAELRDSQIEAQRLK